MAVKEDVTERKESEKALRAAEAAIRESEQRSRLLLESAGEGIFGTDVDGRVMFVNPSATRMLGFEAEEMLGRGVHDLIHYIRSIVLCLIISFSWVAFGMSFLQIRNGQINIRFQCFQFLMAK